MKNTVTILGAGAFGTSVATLLSNNGYKVVLWCYEPEVVKEIQEHKENKTYFPGVTLDANISATTDLQEALESSKWIFQAIPVKFLRSIFQKIKPYATSEHIFVSLSKGIENDTLLFPTQIMQDVLGKDTKVAVVAGPNFAQELAEKHQTAATVSADDKNIMQELGQILANDYFVVDYSQDLIGVQVGGAVKNVLALAVGMVNHSMNTKAFILTKGLQEMGVLVKYFGGERETIYGLSGFGDLVLTATGSLSRNLTAGMLLGQGKTLEEVKDELHVLPEGCNTVSSLYQIIEKNNLDMPICKATYKKIVKE